jgi:hypothetical protein
MTSAWPRRTTPIERAASLPIVLYQARSAPAHGYQWRHRSPDPFAARQGHQGRSWEVATFEQNWRFVQQRRPDIAVLVGRRAPLKLRDRQPGRPSEPRRDRSS